MKSVIVTLKGNIRNVNTPRVVSEIIIKSNNINNWTINLQVHSKYRITTCQRGNKLKSLNKVCNQIIMGYNTQSIISNIYKKKKRIRVV